MERWTPAFSDSHPHARVSHGPGVPNGDSHRRRLQRALDGANLWRFRGRQRVDGRPEERKKPGKGTRCRAWDASRERSLPDFRRFRPGISELPDRQGPAGVGSRHRRGDRVSCAARITLRDESHLLSLSLHSSLDEPALQPAGTSGPSAWHSGHPGRTQGIFRPCGADSLLTSDAERVRLRPRLSLRREAARLEDRAGAGGLLLQRRAEHDLVYEARGADDDGSGPRPPKWCAWDLRLVRHASSSTPTTSESRAASTSE